MTSGNPPGQYPSARVRYGEDRLRPMVAADLAVVLALEHELFPDDPWSAAMFAEEIAQPADTRLYLVAEADGDINDGDSNGGDGTDGDINGARGRGAARGTVLAGYAGMMFPPGDVQADVLTIAVRPAHWGSGIGSALLATLIKAARERGRTEVFLEVRADNPRARGLYQRRGFAQIGVRRGYYQPSGTDAIVMRKDLLR